MFGWNFSEYNVLLSFIFFNVNKSSSVPFLDRSVITPTSFVYGNSIDDSRFVQLEDMECNFQALNLTFQVLMEESRYKNTHLKCFFYIYLHILFLCGAFTGHKQGAQQVAWLHCGHQDSQPAGWQRSRDVPHRWNTGGCQQQSICMIPPGQIVIY